MPRTFEFVLQAFGADLRPVAARTESLGLDGIAVADHPGATWSPFVALGSAAAVTERLGIGSYGIDVTDAVIRTGDLRHTPDNAHHCRMFRWHELREMFSRQPCILLAASASNAASAGDTDALERFAGHPDWWQRLLDWEEELAQEPGALDGGTHTIFALQRA